MNIAHTTLLACAFGLLLPSAHAADNAAATVNNKPIKQSLVDFIVKDATARGQQIDDNTRNVIINKLVSSELVVQEAQKLGLDKQPDYLAREELLRQELLVNTYLENYIKKNPVSEADIKAEYEKFRKQMGDKEYSARHILVKTEQEAKDIILQLGKGNDFAKLAKEKSQDPGSKENGGDLGWFSPGSMVKPFSDAVAKLAKGKYSATPVQTQFGWHVIKLEDTRNAQPPAYDTVKPALQKKIQQQNIEKMLLSLRDKAKVVINSGKK
jgi:peptidyl-prolyl cis-trans isomerase C